MPNGCCAVYSRPITIGSYCHQCGEEQLDNDVGDTGGEAQTRAAMIRAVTAWQWKFFIAHVPYLRQELRLCTYKKGEFYTEEEANAALHYFMTQTAVEYVDELLDEGRA
jgi:hypothetical protein